MVFLGKTIVFVGKTVVFLGKTHGVSPFFGVFLFVWLAEKVCVSVTVHEDLLATVQNVPVVESQEGSANWSLREGREGKVGKEGTRAGFYWVFFG